MEMVVEPEIKIEYYESHETDQLNDNINFSGNVVTSMFDLDDIEISRHKETLKSTLTNQRRDCPNTNTKITWYKSIDSSGKLLCKFCNLKYITEDTLRCHIQKRHSNQYIHLKKSILNYKRKTSHVCRICKKIFDCIPDLKIHVNVNHKIDIIKSSCTECDATFSDISELSRHMYVKHDRNVKSFQSFICEICGYRTKKKSHLEQHLICHQEEKVLSCQKCDYKTNLKSNLRIHNKIHTKIEVFKCEFMDCNYCSSSKASLRGHMLKHFPEKNMLFCDKCSYKTVYKHSLKKHSDSHKRNCTRVK